MNRSQRLTIMARDNGAVTIQADGNLTIAEVLLGLELYKDRIIANLQQTGMSGPIPNLNPRRVDPAQARVVA